jgi:hypothetical protein
MRFLTRLRRWLRRKGRERRGNAVLREFVYLDEVSVYSLLASRSGPVATEFTNVESESLRGESASGFTLNAGAAKGELRSRLERAQTLGSQVVRKASAQARFKQLLDDEQDEMLLRAEPRTARPRIRGAADKAEIGQAGKHRDWVLDATELRRGSLLELEVELAAEEIYGVSQTMSSLLNILQDDPQAFGLGDEGGVWIGTLMTRILDALLVGLVPIRARVVSHESVRQGELELVVHRELLEQLDESLLANLSPRPVYVVGVTEIGLFWKDVRRILFSSNTYLMLSRLGKPGLQIDWTPIKLVDVVRDVMPAIAEQLDSTGRGLLAAMRDSQGQQAQRSRADQMNRALALFAQDLSAASPVGVTVEELSDAGLLLDVNTPFVDTPEGRRTPFARVAEWLTERDGQPIDRERAAVARGTAMVEALYVEDSSLDSGSTEGPPEINLDGPCLDSEIIAVYW